MLTWCFEELRYERASAWYFPNRKQQVLAKPPSRKPDETGLLMNENGRESGLDDACGISARSFGANLCFNSGNTLEIVLLLGNSLIRRSPPVQHKMSSNAAPRKRIQFVMVSNPAEASSAQTRKKAHSHAAREAHAKARRMRAQQHRKAQETSDGWSAGHEDAAGLDTTLEPASARTGPVTYASPLGLLLSHCKDPFSTLVKSFTHREYFLLHYCK